jgi:hypothetical protein
VAPAASEAPAEPPQKADPDPRAAHFTRRTAIVEASVPAEDAAKMAGQRMFQFLILEGERSLGPPGFQRPEDRPLVERYGARPMPDTGAAISESHQQYLEAARRYVLAYNRAMRALQKQQEKANAVTARRVVRMEELRRKFDALGCVLVGPVRNVQRQEGGYSYERRVERQGRCEDHNGHFCVQHEIIYEYRPGRLLDPGRIYRVTHDSLVGIEVKESGPFTGAPTLRTSQPCYRLYDQMERIGPI